MPWFPQSHRPQPLRWPHGEVPRFQTPCQTLARKIQSLTWQLQDAERTGGESDWVRELKEEIVGLYERADHHGCRFQ
jgi:hypothetical protein